LLVLADALAAALEITDAGVVFGSEMVSVFTGFVSVFAEAAFADVSFAGALAWLLGATALAGAFVSSTDLGAAAFGITAALAFGSAFGFGSAFLGSAFAFGAGFNFVAGFAFDSGFALTSGFTFAAGFGADFGFAAAGSLFPMTSVDEDYLDELDVRLRSGTLAPVVTNRTIERAYEVRLMIASRARSAAP